MFGRKKQISKLEYDAECKRPVLRCSICTGEQVGCLQNLKTGELEEIMVIRNPQELEQFRKLTGVREIPKIY